MNIILQCQYNFIVNEALLVQNVSKVIHCVATLVNFYFSDGFESVFEPGNAYFEGGVSVHIYVTLECKK